MALDFGAFWWALAIVAGAWLGLVGLLLLVARYVVAVWLRAVWPRARQDLERFTHAEGVSGQLWYRWTAVRREMADGWRLNRWQSAEFLDELAQELVRDLESVNGCPQCFALVKGWTNPHAVLLRAAAVECLCALVARALLRPLGLGRLAGLDP